MTPSQTLRVCGRLLGLACEGMGRVWDESEVGWVLGGRA